MASLETFRRESECAAAAVVLVGRNLAGARSGIEGCGAPLSLRVLEEIEELCAKSGAPDLIVVDSETAAGWSGADTVHRLCSLAGAPAIIVLIGPVGEEAAIDLVKAGAADCVRKDRLGRLGPAVCGALAERGDAPCTGGSLEEARRKNAHLTRLYSVLSRVSQAIMHTLERDGLFRDVCRITVEQGGFRMAWFGVIDPPGGRVVPLAHYGHEEGYLDGLVIPLADEPGSRGPTGTAVRENRCCICHDIGSDSRMGPWRDAALRRGYRSSGAFPVRLHGKSVGALTLYGAEPGFFDPEAVSLLEEVASEMSFALESMEREEQRRQAERDRTQLAERVQQAHAQAAAEKKFRDLLETVPEAILEVDLDGCIRLMNRSAEDLFGYCRCELVGERIELLVPERFRNAHAGMRLGAGPSPVPHMSDRRDVPALHKNGAEFTAEISLQPIRTEEGPMVICVVRDVTARKRAEQALRESTGRVARILESITDGFFALDRDWRFTYLNGKAEQILGRKRDDLLAKVLWQEFPDLGGSLFEEQFRKAASSQAPLEFEGHGAAWPFSAEFHVYPSEEGLSVYFQDITARQHLEEQLRRSQKMEALGLLAGGVAHDFNNLLTIIGGYGQMALDAVGSDHPLRRELEPIMEAAECASGLTRQLLAFSRRQIVQPRVLDLNRLVSKMNRMVRRLIGEDIDLSIALASDLGRVNADPGQIEQVVMNLLVNARDAMPGGGRLTIATSEVDSTEDSASIPAGLPRGRYVTLSVSDTGTGMTAEVKNRLFEPFFTTKGKGSGTGLGLSTVYGIVKQSGGEISVDSEVGRGATFRMYLPRVEERSSPRCASSAAAGLHTGSETILLVEDEAVLRKLAREMLVRNGYRVVHASCGAEAVRVWRRHRHSIHLLLTDVVMPQMSGPQLAEQLLTAHPKLKVLYMSGYADEVMARHGLTGGDVAFLQKPFTQQDLTRKVRAVLDGAGHTR